MKYWITNDELGPAYDEEVEALAVGDRVRGGRWRIREDQAAGPVDLTPADPRESAAADEDTTPAEVAPDTTTGTAKKGS